jgi:hypothetical protein
MPSTNSQYFYLRELVSPETMNALYNGVGEKLSSYFPIAPSILNGLSYTQTGTTNVISIKDGVIRWVDQANALSSSPQFTWAAIVAIPALGVTCPTSATQKYIVAKVTKTQIDLANLSFTGAILPTAYTLAEISALSSPAEYAPLWTITNNSGTYAIGTDTNCAFNYGANTAANLALYAKLAANQTFTGSNAFAVSPTAPTPVVTDTTTKVATMAAINQAVTGYSIIDVSTAVGGVITVSVGEASTQWLTCSGAASSDITFMLPARVKVYNFRLSLSGNYNFYVKIGTNTATQVYNGLNILPTNGASFYSQSAISSANIYNNSYYNYDIATNDDSYRLANTALVQAVAALMGKLAANNTWTGQNVYSVSPTVPTIAGTTDSTTKAAPTSFVQQVAALKSNIVSPLFTGTISTKPLTTYNVSSQLGTSLKVAQQLSSDLTYQTFVISPVGSTASGGMGWFRLYKYDVDGGNSTYKQLFTMDPDSGVVDFTYIPTLPTASPGSDNTDGANTAFVRAALTANGGGIVASGTVGNTSYVQFQDGYKIMRGLVGIVCSTPGVYYATITYPIAFTGASTGRSITTGISYSAQIQDQTQVIIDSGSTTNSQLVLGAGTDRLGTTTFNVYWIAEGY